MSFWYVDTSALLKLLVREVESEALLSMIELDSPDLVACYLLETELRRAVARYDGLTQADATQILGAVSLYDVPPSIFREAGLLPGAQLRALDALHLASAVRLGVDHLITYDTRMASAAQDLGLTVLAPS